MQSQLNNLFFILNKYLLKLDKSWHLWHELLEHWSVRVFTPRSFSFESKSILVVVVYTIDILHEISVVSLFRFFTLVDFIVLFLLKIFDHSPLPIINSVFNKKKSITLYFGHSTSASSGLYLGIYLPVTRASVEPLKEKRIIFLL